MQSDEGGGGGGGGGMFSVYNETDTSDDENSWNRVNGQGLGESGRSNSSPLVQEVMRVRLLVL